MAKKQSEEFWQSHLEAWRQSGLTQVAYCTNQGLSLKSFYRWRGKEKETAGIAKPSLTLVPVSINAPTTGSTLQIHSPSGWRIELSGDSPPRLADLLRALP